MEAHALPRPARGLPLAMAGGAVPWLLLAATLALIALGSLLARPGVDMAAEDPAAGRTLVRFFGVEANETDSYRWSEPLAGVFLYGYDGRPALVTLRLTAPRPGGAAAVTVTARAGDRALGQFRIEGGWRRYRLLAPSSPAGESALLLETPAFVPADDPRELGFALSHVRVGPAGSAPWPAPVRAAFLLALPLLGWLLLGRLGAPQWAATGAGALLTLAAGWAAAYPTASSYWLPTLGWPWWPLAPLALLLGWPRLRHVLAAGRAWIDSRPMAAWAGIGLAFAAIIGMRLGLPWPLGMGLLAAGAWAGLSNAACSMQHAESTVPTSRLWLLAILAVTALATFLRLYNLDGQPGALWRDESRHGLQALRIWSDPSYRPVYVVEGADLPALLFYLMAPVLGLLGPHAWSARLVSALAGALTPLALYWAGSPLIGRRAALIGAALVAWASWSLSMSRWAFPATLDHILVLTAVGLLWRGMQIAECGMQNAKLRTSYILHFAAAGLLAGLAVYAYHTGRMAPLALAAVAAIRLGRSGAAWRRAGPGLVVAALVGALTIAPLAFYILSDLDGYNRRVGSVSILDSNDPQTHSPAGLILGNLGRYLLMFHVSGDTNGRHHMPGAPMLDPAAGLLLALGLGAALTAARRRPGVAAVLALGAVYLVPGVFSGNAPHAMRSLGTLAPAAMLGGLGLAALATGGQAARLSLPLVLAASLAFNLWLYFGAMRTEPLVYGEFDMVETAMGRIAAAPSASAEPDLGEVRVYLPERLRRADTVAFLTARAQTYAYTGAALPPDGPALVLLPGDASAAEQSEALAALGSEGGAVGPLPTFPGTDRPIILAFGRGDAAKRLMEAVVD
jgi:4-amino-4-deoxy-L-arabinose transferase-like glycosyltransferase